MEKLTLKQRKQARSDIEFLIRMMGEDTKRDGLKDTPDRALKAWCEMLNGYGKDPASVFKAFEQPYDEMLIVRNVSFYSVCEHHLLPFFGTACIAYIPSDRVIGLSKMVRLLRIYAHRLQIQERICQQVTSDLDRYLSPIGSACILEAKHLCMSCRGVKDLGASMITSSLTGVFREMEPRAELMRLIK